MFPKLPWATSLNQNKLYESLKFQIILISLDGDGKKFTETEEHDVKNYHREA